MARFLLAARNATEDLDNEIFKSTKSLDKTPKIYAIYLKA